MHIHHSVIIPAGLQDCWKPKIEFCAKDCGGKINEQLYVLCLNLLLIVISEGIVRRDWTRNVQNGHIKTAAICNYDSGSGRNDPCVMAHCP